MKSKKPSDNNDTLSKKRNAPPSDVEILRWRRISTEEAKQRAASGFYCRPSVLRVVAQRLLRVLQVEAKPPDIEEDETNS